MVSWVPYVCWVSNCYLSVNISLTQRSANQVFHLYFLHYWWYTTSRQIHSSFSAMRMDCLKLVSSVGWVNDTLVFLSPNVFWLNQGLTWSRRKKFTTDWNFTEVLWQKQEASSECSFAPCCCINICEIESFKMIKI